MLNTHLKVKALSLILVIIFVCEMFVMSSLYFLKIESVVLEMILDGLLLSIIAAPFLHYFLIKKIMTRNLNLIFDLKRQKETLDLSALVSETDLKGVITYSNELFCKLSGYTEDELMGKTHRLVNSGVHDHFFWKIYWQTLERGDIWRGDVCNKKKDGSLYWVNAVVSPIKNQKGSTTGYSSIRVDITDKKKSEEKEKKALAVKSEFLANMSHEIRTPMNGILGMVSLLEESSLTEDQKKMLKTISSCGDGLMTILNDILDLSKIESGKLELEVYSFSLKECIVEVFDLTSRKAYQKKIKMTYEIVKNIPDLFLGDATRIKQILMNYLSNSLKFTNEGGDIFLKVDEMSNEGDTYQLKFSVKDSGIGISKKNQRKLFKAFVQADTSTTREFGGTGLGLAIISNLVEVMNGTFDLESEEGKGSVFSVTLPLIKSYENLKKESPPDEELGSLGRLRHKILLVEDNPINQKIVKMMLTNLGFSCDLASNGLEALEALEELEAHKYTLIFMDMQMPEMDGLAATRAIIEKYKKESSPIVAMTANAFSEDKKACFDAGMDDFIGKPIRKKDLIRVLLKYGK